ncbi:hypothetical protein Nepgr_017259 [Nepenthes gracilis]|uniref:EDR1/CTR1/ARMC3-like peptidase-like domain-containing protein n=1 Tax=Nepenthes gracilis TaxID=150966 RepID=A0AAD3XSB8_NEPGR|nr:hypothetical protein Nepgr_017259 [Nepenthes gracilis]
MDQYVWAMCTDLQESGHNPSIESLMSVDPVHSSIAGLAELVYNHIECAAPIGKEEFVLVWEECSDDLKDCLGSVVLPIGSLSVGLYRHPAWLFKVMDVTIDLPCQIARGYQYYHKDSAISCRVWFEPGRGYIVDLIGNPGSVVNEEEVEASVLQKQLDMNMLFPDRNNQGSCSIMKDEPSQLPMPSKANQPTRRDKDLQLLKCCTPQNVAWKWKWKWIAWKWIAEYLSKGSLYRLLYKPGTRENLDEKHRLNVAKGMNYLRKWNLPRVHGDLIAKFG